MLNLPCSKLKAKFCTDITIGIGSICEQIFDIPQSYIDASSALDYMLIKGSNRIIYFNEIIEHEDYTNTYPYKEFETLRILIFKGDIDEIEDVLANILKYTKICNLPLFMVKQLCFDLINTIYKTIMEINKTILLSKNSYFNTKILAEFQTVDELIDSVKLICSNICILLREYKVSNESSLVENMISYIRNNCCNCDFSIQAMSDHFGMTLTGLSQYFKNKTGQTIIDFSTQLRIEKAKQLLQNSELTLNEIIPKLGYSTASSFIRRFKQFTGITPGQYIKENKR